MRPEPSWMARARGWRPRAWQLNQGRKQALRRLVPRLLRRGWQHRFYRQLPCIYFGGTVRPPNGPGSRW